MNLVWYGSDSEQTWNSTGLTLWRSSSRLCRYLASRDGYDALTAAASASSITPSGRAADDDGGGLRLLELGSGLGMCGLFAHIMLLSSVGGTSTDDALVASEGATTATITTVTTVLTDGDTDVLKLLRVNAKNNVRCIDDGNGDDDGDESCDDAKGSSSLTCRQLLWGEERAMEFLRAEAQRRRNRDRRHRRRPHRKSSSSSSAATRRRRRSRSAPGRLSYSPEPRPRAT